MLTLHSFCKSKSCEKTAGGCWMQPRHRLWCALFGFFFLWFHKVRHPLHRSLSIQLGMFWCLFFHDFFLFGFHKFCWYFIHPLLRLHHLECELCHFSHRRWSFCCGFGCLLLWRLCHLGKVLCKRLWVLRINNTFGKNMSLELGNIGHLVGMRKCFELIRKENTWNLKCKKGHALAGCRMLPTKDFDWTSFDAKTSWNSRTYSQTFCDMLWYYLCMVYSWVPKWPLMQTLSVEGIPKFSKKYKRR